MDTKTRLATGFSCAVVIAAVAWSMRHELARRSSTDGFGTSTFENRSRWIPSFLEHPSFSQELPPVFHDLTLRIDPSLPSDAARDFRGTNWDDSFDEIGDYGYTAEQMFHFDAELASEGRLVLFASVGEWGNPHAFRFEIPAGARAGDSVRAAGEAWIDLGPSKWRLEGLSGSLTLARTDFAPGSRLSFRFEVRYFESGDPKKWTRLVASGVVVVEE